MSSNEMECLFWGLAAGALTTILLGAMHGQHYLTSGLCAVSVGVVGAIWNRCAP